MSYKAIRIAILLALALPAVCFIVWRQSEAAPNPNLSGDLNNDNVVDLTDLSILLSHFNSAYANADLDGDGQVKLVDLSMLLSGWGNSYTPPDNTQAAVRYNWGQPMTVSDEFNYGTPASPARVDAVKWSDAGNCFAGHNSNGRRCGKNSVVDGSKLVMTGDANGDTGWLAQELDRQYGRWEVRARSFNIGTSGGNYHPVFLIWPTSEQWPADGEYDWLENSVPGDSCAGAFLHYPHPSLPVQQEPASKCPVDLSQWHNFAFEWTSQYVKGYIDGEEWFSFANGQGPAGRSCIQCMPSGHLNIQLDNFTGSSGLKPAEVDVDWVRVYEP
jgi:hypothetical protein